LFVVAIRNMFVDAIRNQLILEATARLAHISSKKSNARFWSVGSLPHAQRWAQ
jgi:hypothetical protein